MNFTEVWQHRGRFGMQAMRHKRKTLGFECHVICPDYQSSPGFALSVPERTTFTLSSTHFPSPEDGLLDLLHAIIVTDRGKDRGSSFSHHGGVSLHHV
jgi:hypothetical protein